MSNEIHTIADIYMNMSHEPVCLLHEQDDSAQPEVDEYGVSVINIYIRPANGAIQRPYSGEVINTTTQNDTTTLIARDESNNKLIQVISTQSDEISVTVMDDQGRVQDTFLGKNIDFYDTQESGTELNIIKIENV